MTRVVVHIDKLILRGIDRADAAAVSKGLQAELHGLLGEPGITSQISRQGSIPRVKVEPLQHEAGTAAHRLGSGIGRRIVSGISAERRK